MAEAHQAVAFSFSVTHEGVAVDFDHEVLKLIFNSGVRSWKKRIARLKNGIKNGVFPGSIGGLMAVETVVCSSYIHGYDPSFGLIDRLVEHLPSDSKEMRVLAAAAVGFGGWATLILSVRQILKMLLVYKGWMYEERGPGRKVSIPTRFWLLGLKLLSGWRKPMLYSFQGSLPHLPLPSVDETLTRYLRSVRPLMDDDQYHRMERLAREFRNGIAKKLQRYLILKRMWSTNYVSDWWEEYVYLRGRSPIMVNSNFYGIDAILRHPTSIQAARAANVVYAAMLFRRALERQEVEPIMVQGLVPLCSAQYERIFNTTRIPGLETDRIVHLPDSTHIAVYAGGKFWKVNLYHKGRLMKPVELEMVFQKILDDTSLPGKGEEKLAALTAGERTAWARARQQFFAKGMNKISLDAIEKAAFFLSFDDEEFHYDPKDHTKLDHYGRVLLHGKGYDRWFDKSFTLCIGKNGKVGFNAEHSWADAAVIAHFWEFVLSEDVIVLGYKSDGHCIGTPEFEPPAASRLRWELPAECLDVIEESNRVAQALLNDVDLRLYVHDAYGKGLMKKFKVSPDAYIQMALQLAYFRDAGKFNLTYEASMTRLFKEGRTETVRPCTIESCAWVRSMEDQKSSNKERFDLLRLACQVHQRGYQDAMCGKGIDRHLFCLYVISKYLEIDSPFLKEVLSEPWRLSTSQTPHGQTNKLDLNRYPDCISAGGGFGPVADDGYGVSYIIAGEGMLFFHISSKKSSPETDSDRFARQIEKALADMRKIFENKDK